MGAQFYYTNDSERGVESIVISGSVVRTVPGAHPNFIKIRDYCLAQQSAGEELDIDLLLKLADAGPAVVEGLLRLTDRVSYKGGNLLWDGVAIQNALSAHIVRMIRSGEDNYVPFAKFLENLDQNPSQASKDSLFEWIADRDFTITEDGHFVGYKGVTASYQSKQSGYGIVNGVETTGYLDNTVGNIVEVPRNRVDENRDSACSYGLHIGTRSYASDYARSGKMIIVAVNPRDVVMVPRDGDGHKMRVCRYVVLDDNDAELTVTTYKGAHRADVEDEDEGQPLSDACGACGGLLDPEGYCYDCEQDDDHCTECGEADCLGYCDDESDEPDECPDCGCDLDSNGECDCRQYEVYDQDEDEDDAPDEDRPTPQGRGFWGRFRGV